MQEKIELDRYNGAIHQEGVEERHKVEERLKKDEETIPIDKEELIEKIAHALAKENCVCGVIDWRCFPRTHCFVHWKGYIKEILLNDTPFLVKCSRQSDEKKEI